MDLVTGIKLAFLIPRRLLKFPEKFDHPFSHLLIVGNILPEGHHFVVATVTSCKNFVSLYKFHKYGNNINIIIINIIAY